jgi:phospholipase/carboxylesterase
MKQVVQSNLKTPVFIAHGLSDSVVDLTLGEYACHRLQDLGMDIAWHTYPMQHSVCAEEILDIGRWITLQLTE